MCRKRLAPVLGILFLLLSSLPSCQKIRGPRGLRQSEWVAYCSDNIALPNCDAIPADWPGDSVYLAGLIFEPHFLQEYRCDTIGSDMVCGWVDLNDSETTPEIRKDTILLVRDGIETGLFGYRLDDGRLTITSVNPAISELQPGTVFTNVRQIPDNYGAIVEVP